MHDLIWVRGILIFFWILLDFVILHNLGFDFEHFVIFEFHPGWISYFRVIKLWNAVQNSGF